MRKVPARQEVTSLYRLDPTPFTPLKRWESKGTSPLGESARAELSRPCPSPHRVRIYVKEGAATSAAPAFRMFSTRQQPGPNTVSIRAIKSRWRFCRT